MSLDNLKDRLLKFSKWNGECLESTYKARTQSGYAIMKFGKTTRGAHRVSWMVFRGEIPEGLWVLHSCNNPLCIRIDHLYLGTPKDNTDYMVSCGRQNFLGAKKYDDEIVDRAIQLRRSGMTYRKIAEELGMTIAIVHMCFRRVAFKCKVADFFCVPKYSQEIRQEAIRLRESGIKCKDIQKILKIPKRSLTRIFVDHYSKK